MFLRSQRTISFRQDGRRLHPSGICFMNFYPRSFSAKKPSLLFAFTFTCVALCFLLCFGYWFIYLNIQTLRHRVDRCMNYHDTDLSPCAKVCNLLCTVIGYMFFSLISSIDPFESNDRLFKRRLPLVYYTWKRVFRSFSPPRTYMCIFVGDRRSWREWTELLYQVRWVRRWSGRTWCIYETEAPTHLGAASSWNYGRTEEGTKGTQGMPFTMMPYNGRIDRSLPITYVTFSWTQPLCSKWQNLMFLELHFFA